MNTMYVSHKYKVRIALIKCTNFVKAITLFSRNVIKMKQLHAIVYDWG